MATGEAPEGVQAPVAEPTPGQPQEAGQGPPDAPEAGQELPDLDQLLERYDPDTLRKNRKLMGIAGSMADRLAQQRAEQLADERANRLVEERWEREQAERSRKAALEAARRGDYQRLGEMRAREVLTDDQKRYVDTFRQKATNDAYGSVQRTIDEIASGFPQEVVAAAAEKLGEVPGNLRFEDGLKRWLPALIEARAEHMASAPETQKKVEAKLTPALKSRLIAEMNGTEPVADSGGGKAPRQRQITDEQIAEMSPEEWVQVYDVKAGKFKPGVAYKPTRALDPAAMRLVGRSG